MIAMTLGTTFHESLNLFIRWMAEASRKADGDASFWYRNVDLPADAARRAGHGDVP